METAMMVVIVVLLIISIVGVFKGLDLKTWSSWFYAACAFLGGMLAGLLRTDLYLGLMLGAILAALIVYGGVMTQWHRQRYNKEMARAWLARNEGKPALSLLASILRRLINK